MTKVALYARVSTSGQTTENQLSELRAVAERLDWEIVAEYVDNGISGAKGRNGRPQFDAMQKAAVRREFDLVAAWSVDRLGRSLLDLIEFLREIHSKNVDLYLHQQGIDTPTPAGRAMFQMMGVFAEFEREIIRERINSGINRAQIHGTKSGKPIGRPRLEDWRDKRGRKVGGGIKESVMAARSEGKGIKKIARELKLGVGTVHRIVREAA